MASDLDQVRRIARAAGMFPAVTVAHALESALARGERGPLIRGWLDILRDAVGCDTQRRRHLRNLRRGLFRPLQLICTWTR